MIDSQPNLTIILKLIFFCVFNLSGSIPQPIINPLKITETWQDPRKCSFGQKHFTYSCLIPSDNKFYAELCPGQSRSEQIYKECPCMYKTFHFFSFDFNFL